MVLIRELLSFPKTISGLTHDPHAILQLACAWTRHRSSPRDRLVPSEIPDIRWTRSVWLGWVPLTLIQCTVQPDRHDARLLWDLGWNPFLVDSPNLA